jgi:hypothetical protein
MMDEEWTDWFPHDDNGWPARVRKGDIVQADMGDEILCPMGAEDLDWHCPGDPVLRFRIRKPKALRELINMVERLPVSAKEDA